MSSIMSLFVAGLGRSSSKEGRAAMLIGDMDIFRLMAYVQQVLREKLRDREVYRNKKSKTSARPTQYEGSVAQGRSLANACAKCGRTQPCCFKCGQECHIMSECPKKKQDSRNSRNKNHSSSVIPLDMDAPKRSTSGTR
ncbi:uncharacterized protein [Solanum lycopersicum]|uniref:uncharacterized protein n=1 Tax=Solanum lycopersicum TaxID=4081 RepID=UPI003749F6DB